MREIPLTQGQVALVDDEDFEELNQFKWCAYWAPHARTFYAVRRDGKRLTLMHRQITKAPPGRKVDHRNRIGFDNQKLNLRFATESQNSANSRLPSNNTSGFRGVSRNRQKWQSRIRYNGRKIHLGSFDCPEEAAKAYDRAARHYFGEFATPNFPESV
jgi:hypothetical protein